MLKWLTPIASPYGICFPWVLLNPWPVPVKTRAHLCRHGLRREQVRVASENPRVARDIPYVWTLKISTCSPKVCWNSDDMWLCWMLNFELQLGSSPHPKWCLQCVVCDVQPALIEAQCKLISDYGKPSLLPLYFLTPGSNSAICPSRNLCPVVLSPLRVLAMSQVRMVIRFILFLQWNLSISNYLWTYTSLWNN
jgi:hypothetical protein